MNELQIFNNQEFGEVRTVDIDGEVWFVGKDICKAFGDKNHNRSIGRIDDEDKNIVPIIDSIGREQNIVVINESGLYALLFSMQPQKTNNNGVVSDAYPIEVKERIEKLHRFKRWVTHEVLPSIRKTGGYIIPKDYPSALRALADAEEKRLALIAENEELSNKVEIQTQIIEDYEPKVQYYDTILKSNEALTVTQIAADYGMSAQQLNKILHEEGFQRRVGRQWILYRENMGNGYTKSETIQFVRPDGSIGSNTTTKWTQKGRLKIHNILESRGIKALMDQQDLFE